MMIRRIKIFVSGKFYFYLTNKMAKENVNMDEPAFNKSTIHQIEKKSRGEKRARKALENFSYEKMKFVTKAFFQKSGNAAFVINKPDVYKNSKNQSFLIFGETSYSGTGMINQKN